jgi:hypothetical protein
MLRSKSHPAQRVFEGGREVLEGELWRKRKIEVWHLDTERCVACHMEVGPPIQGMPDAAEIHHVFGRGMAGGFRSDAIFTSFDGQEVRNLVTLCAECHRNALIKSKYAVVA